MKKYFLYSLKRYIPFFVICFALCLSSFLTSIASIEVTATHIESLEGEPLYFNSYSSNSALAGIITPAVILFIFSVITPFIANSYRYSLRSADVFNQIGGNKKRIRFMNNFILLGALIVSFTVAYAFSILVLALKEIPNYIDSSVKSETFVMGDEVFRRITTPVFYKLIYFLPVYFLLLIIGVLNYFISYFFITRANNVLNSIIILVLGEVILLLTLATPIYYTLLIYSLTDNLDSFYNAYDTDFLVATRNASFIGVTALICYFFNGLINGDTSTFIDAMKELEPNQIMPLIVIIISFISFIAVGVIGILYFLKEKETSGEYAGKPMGRDKFQSIIFHAGAFLIASWYMTLSSSLLSAVSWTGLSLISFIPAVVTCAALYYVFYSLLRRNFRLHAKDLAILLPIYGSAFMLALTANIVSYNINILI